MARERRGEEEDRTGDIVGGGHTAQRNAGLDFAAQLALAASDNVVALVPRLARPPLGADLVVRGLKRQPKRDIAAAWRLSADASPSIRALLAELA